MKELSLNILDIVENSTKAGATLVEISLQETNDTLTITVKDNGYGMSDETCKAALDPFYTTRTTRSVGMGIPLFKMMAEQTGGSLTLLSKSKQEYGDASGTIISALFYKNHIDFTPLGDVVSTILTLIQGHPETNFLYEHKSPEREVTLDTRELREVLGDVSLAKFEVVQWIKEYLNEQYSQDIS
ncbi:MAG: sensor histidine kinase [Clostridia bacterium]|nr:sensor histidine kinase [Clostridia bacterium]